MEEFFSRPCEEFIPDSSVVEVEMKKVRQNLKKEFEDVGEKFSSGRSSSESLAKFSKIRGAGCELGAKSRLGVASQSASNIADSGVKRKGYKPENWPSHNFSRVSLLLKYNYRF